MKWNLSCYSPRVLAVLFGFRRFVRRGGGRQRQQWHLIPLPTRAATRCQMVWQGPRLGFVAESGRFVTMNALSTISCFCALLPTFIIFSCLIPVCFISFVFLRLCGSSHLLLTVLPASTYVCYSTCSCVICILPHLGIPLFFYSFSIFFVVLIYRVALFCCALVPGTLALDLHTWIL